VAQGKKLVLFGTARSCQCALGLLTARWRRHNGNRHIYEIISTWHITFEGKAS